MFNELWLINDVCRRGRYNFIHLFFQYIALSVCCSFNILRVIEYWIHSMQTKNYWRNYKLVWLNFITRMTQGDLLLLPIVLSLIFCQSFNIFFLINRFFKFDWRLWQLVKGKKCDIIAWGLKDQFKRKKYNVNNTGNEAKIKQRSTTYTLITFTFLFETSYTTSKCLLLCTT